MSDNGSQFSSSFPYAAFAKKWNFSHVTSSPHYPQSNGLVERFIQTVKHSLGKAKTSGNDPNMAFLCMRTTPADSNVPTSKSCKLQEYREIIEGTRSICTARGEATEIEKIL